MSDETNYLRLPWTLQHGHLILDCDGDQVNECNGFWALGPAICKILVPMVNSYAKLLAACKAIIETTEWFENMECPFGLDLGTCPESNNCKECNAYKLYREAIAEAEQQP